MSRSQVNNLLVGISLIGAGVFYLLYNMQLIPEPTPQAWALIFAGASLYFLACYALTGFRLWGWLFPTFIFAGVAGTIWMSENTTQDALIAAPVLAGVGLPFLAVYLIDRKNWWALIPFYVMAVIIGIVTIVDSLPEEMVGAFVLWAIALPFLVVYLTNKTRTWALIPAGIMAAIGLIPLMTTVVKGEAIASLVMFLIALPFFVVYFISSRNWWALMPAGILASIGVALLVMNAASANKVALLNGIMYLGWGITFGVLWLRRSSLPTRWAVFPAIGFLAAGILAFLTHRDFGQYWPFLIILLGLYILVRGVTGKK